MPKSREEEKAERVKEVKLSLDKIYGRQEEISTILAEDKQAMALAQEIIQTLGDQRADLEKKLIDLDVSADAKKKSLDERLEGAQEELRQIRLRTKDLEKETVDLKEYAEKGEAEYKDITGNYYKKPKEEVEQSREAAAPTRTEAQAEQSKEAPAKKSPSEITDTTAIEVFIPTEDKGSFVNKELLIRLSTSSEELSERQLKDILNDPNIEQLEMIHDAVNLGLKDALAKGSMKKIEPTVSQGDPNSCSYEHDGGKLNQKERSDGKFEFAPEANFSGILRVERKDKDGNLLKDQADIIEYKDGKPIAVIPAQQGETRIANFGNIARAAGIEVSESKETTQEAGVRVSTFDPGRFSDGLKAKPTREVPKPPVSPHNKDKEGPGIL